MGWCRELGWLEIPEKCHNGWLQKQSILIKALSSLAPVHCSLKDKWGWGSTGVYSVGLGFSTNQPPHASMLTPALWKLIWSSYGLPKVNYFSWLLMHQKDLTRNNLCKRGFLGPHHCCLYKAAPKNSDHLFIECEFTQSVWRLVLLKLPIAAPSGSTMPVVFSNWMEIVPTSNYSSIGRITWYIIPKWIWWAIWLAQNDLLFNAKVWTPAKVAIKVKLQILEILRTCSSSMPQEMIEWLGCSLKINV